MIKFSAADHACQQQPLPVPLFSANAYLVSCASLLERDITYIHEVLSKPSKVLSPC